MHMQGKVMSCISQRTHNVLYFSIYFLLLTNPDQQQLCDTVEWFLLCVCANKYRTERNVQVMQAIANNFATLCSISCFYILRLNLKFCSNPATASSGTQSSQTSPAESNNSQPIIPHITGWYFTDSMCVIWSNHTKSLQTYHNVGICIQLRCSYAGMRLVLFKMYTLGKFQCRLLCSSIDHIETRRQGTLTSTVTAQLTVSSIEKTNGLSSESKFCKWMLAKIDSLCELISNLKLTSCLQNIFDQVFSPQ